MQSQETTSDRAGQSAKARGQQIAAIAVLVILFFGGGALAWWKWHVPTLDEPLIDVAAGRRFMRPEPPAPPRDGVRKTGGEKSDSYELRSGDARMIVSKNQKGEWHYNWRYQPDNVTSRDARAFLGVKYRTSFLELTDDQRKQLDALPAYVGGMVVAEDDQAKLKDQFQAYLAADDADKPAKEMTLVKTLAGVAAESAKPTSAALDAYAAKVKAILTPAQIAKLTQPRK